MKVQTQPEDIVREITELINDATDYYPSFHELRVYHNHVNGDDEFQTLLFTMSRQDCGWEENVRRFAQRIYDLDVPRLSCDDYNSLSVEICCMDGCYAYTPEDSDSLYYCLI